MNLQCWRFLRSLSHGNGYICSNYLERSLRQVTKMAGFYAKLSAGLYYTNLLRGYWVLNCCLELFDHLCFRLGKESLYQQFLYLGKSNVKKNNSHFIEHLLCAGLDNHFTWTFYMPFRWQPRYSLVDCTTWCSGPWPIPSL